MNDISPPTSQLGDSLRQLLADCDNLDERTEKAVTFLSQHLQVAENEVALFLLDDRKTVLHFLWPVRFRQVGFIPYSSVDSLAARTAREGRVFLNNTFASIHHAAFFEKIRLQDGISDRPKPIQKIISVPMVVKSDIRGVIQISRKGDEGDNLADFDEAAATGLVEYAAVIGELL